MSYKKHWENKWYKKLQTLGLLHLYSTEKSLADVVVCCKKYMMKYYIKMGMKPILITDIQFDYTFNNYYWPRDNDHFLISCYQEYENCPFVIKLREKYQKRIKRNISYDYDCDDECDFLEYNEYEFFNFYGYDSFEIFKEGLETGYLDGLESIKRYSTNLDNCKIVICISKKTKNKYLDNNHNACLISEILENKLEDYHFAEEDDDLFDEEIHNSHVKYIVSETAFKKPLKHTPIY